MDFGGEVFVQSTPGFVLGIRENPPDRFSHAFTFIGLKELLVGRSPAATVTDVSPNAARRLQYA